MQETVGMKWCRRAQGIRKFSSWGWSRSGRGCPVKLCHLHPWQFSRWHWINPWPNGWPCFKRLLISQQCFQKFLPTWIILWHWCPATCSSLQLLCCDLEKCLYDYNGECEKHTCSYRHESSTWFTQHRRWDEELAGVEGPSLLNTIFSEQMLAFQKNAVVLGCHLLSKELNETCNKVVVWWHKGIAEMRLLGKKKKANFKIPLCSYQ